MHIESVHRKLLKMSGKFAVLFVCVSAICSAQIGKSHTTPEETPYENKTHELLAKLSENFEKIASQAQSVVGPELVEFSSLTLSYVASMTQGMVRSEDSWSRELTYFMNKAIEKHIDIRSCFGENVEMFEKLYHINRDEMYHCAYVFINITEEYMKKVKIAINATRDEIQEIKREVEACGDNQKCLENMDVMIQDDMKIFPNRIVSLENKTVEVIHILLPIAYNCGNHPYNRYSETGTAIMKGISDCIDRS